MTKLRGLEWSWRRADITPMLGDLGWNIEYQHELGMRLGTQFGMATGDVYCTDDGRVSAIYGAVCSFIDDTPEERALLQDVFVETVAAAATVLGDPTDRLPGEFPEVRWRGPQTTIGVRNSAVLVRIFIATNEYMGRLA
ncbi:DUF6301 family protein [Actinomadura rubrobrunea]|nr:DUF6301 family protein [Actinomadura rubrobrunea]